MKHSRTKQRRPSVKSAFHRLRGWLRHEEEYEQQTFVQGIANVDSLAEAIAHGIGGLVTLTGRAIWKGLTWPFRQIARLIRRGVAWLTAGLRRSLHEFRVVLGEIAHDVRHLVATTGQRLLRAGRWMLTPLLKLGAFISAPVRNRFARQAKAQVMSDVTMTSDQHAHWELLALVAAALVAGGALLAVTGHADSALQLASQAGSQAGRVDPTRIATWLTTASPSALTLAAAGLLTVGLSVWFWIRMTLDAWHRRFPSHLEQTRWRTVTVLLFIPGAVAYFVKVYNRWTLRQFVTYHVSAVLMVGTAILVATSTYGTLWYFNKQADATVQAPAAGVPNLELDQSTRQAILDRPQYGAPLQAGPGGRVDPFAPIPGQGVPAPSPSPSPSPSAAPQP